MGSLSFETAAKVGGNDPTRAVHEAMTSPGLIRTVRPDLPLDRALEWISGRGQALVLDDGRVVGRLTTRDLDRWYRRQVLGEAVPDEAGPIRPDPTSGVSATGGSIRSVGPPSCQTPISRPSWSTVRDRCWSPARRGPASPGSCGSASPSWWSPGPTPSASRSWSSRVARGRPRATRDRPRPLLALEPQRPDLPRPGPPDPPRAVRRPRVRGAARGAVGGRSVRAGAGPPAGAGPDGVARVRAPPHARGFADQIRQFLLRAQEALLTPGHRGQGRRARPERVARARAVLPRLPGRPRRRPRRGLRGVDRPRARGRGRLGRAVARPSARRRLPGCNARPGGADRGAPCRRHRRGRGSRGARVLVPGDDGGPVAPVHRALQRGVARRAADVAPRGARDRDRCVERGAHVGGIRGRRARAPPAARRGGRSLGDLAVVVRRQGAHVGGLRGARRRARPALGARERCLALAGAVDPAVRARAAVARGLGGRARRPRGIRADLRPRPAVPGRGPRPDARVAHADGVRRERPRVLGRADR